MVGPTDRARRRARLKLVLTAALLLVAASPSTASARKTIVVLGVSGPGGKQAARMLSRELRRRYRVLSAGVLSAAARRAGVSTRSRKGLSEAARSAGVDGVLRGQITRVGGRWALRITVYSGHSGSRAGSATILLRGTRLDNSTARRVPGRLARAIGRTRSGGRPHAAVSRRRHRRRPRARRGRRRGRRHRRQAGVQVEALPVPVRMPRQDTPAYQPPQPVQPQPVQPQPMQQPPRMATAPQITDDDGTGFTTASPPPSVATRGGTGDDLGFEVAGGGGKHAGETAETGPAVAKRHKGQRPEWESILELSLGVMAVSRNFDFNDPISPANPEDHSNYRSGIVPAVMLEAALYPFAYFTRGFFANVGLSGRYYRVLGLQSQPPGGGSPVRTTLHTFELGAHYRWNILGRLTSPTLKTGLEFGRLGFVIWDDPTTYVPLPDIAYMYLKLALVHLEVPFYAKNRFSIGVMGSFDYLLILSAGEIESSDSAGYGKSSTGGIDLGGGVFVSYKGFFGRLKGFYRRIFYDFDNSCYHDHLGCRAAGGALDIYTGATALVGYAF